MVMSSFGHSRIQHYPQSTVHDPPATLDVYRNCSSVWYDMYMNIVNRSIELQALWLVPLLLSYRSSLGHISKAHAVLRISFGIYKLMNERLSAI